MLIAGIITGIFAGRPDAVANALTEGGQEAITLCLTLGGGYMLWMGLMNVARRAGLVDALSRLAAPVMGRLFPNEKDAVAPITLNMTANFFGLGSAATPFGLAGMRELQKTNPQKDRATNSMIMFLMINAAAIELLPVNVLALRTAEGAKDVYGVALPTFITSVIVFILAVLLVRLFMRLFR